MEIQPFGNTEARQKREWCQCNTGWLCSRQRWVLENAGYVLLDVSESEPNATIIRVPYDLETVWLAFFGTAIGCIGLLHSSV